MKKTGIAVPPGWNPTGETIHSILYRLQVHNRITAKDLRSYFQLKIRKRKNDNAVWFRSDFDVEVIAQKAGWSSMCIDASFPDFLFCYDDDIRNKLCDRETAEYTSILKCSPFLRICPSCYKDGVHLTLHQSLHWCGCPIHDESLKTKCIECGVDTNSFKNNGDFSKIYKCSNCAYDPYIHDRQTEKSNRKLESMNEYIEWCGLICKVHNNKSNKYLSVTNDKRENYLSNYKRLLNPPEWIVRNTKNLIRKKNNYVIPYAGRVTSIVGLTKIKECDHETCSKNVRSKVSELESYFKEQLLQAFELFRYVLLDTLEFKSDESLDCCVSAVDRCLQNMQSEIDDVIECCFTSSLFWSAWHDGPGNRLALRYRNSRILIVNISYTKAASKTWFMLVLLTFFKISLGKRKRSILSGSPLRRYLNPYCFSCNDSEYLLSEIESEYLESVKNSTVVERFWYFDEINLEPIYREIKSARQAIASLGNHNQFLKQRFH